MYLRVPRFALLAAASALGAIAAFTSARAWSSPDLPSPRASAAPLPAAPATVRWPRALPRDPEAWVKQAASDCGLKVFSARSEAHATTFPTPSGGAMVLWEYGVRLSAEGAPDEVRALMGRLGRTGCVHVPEVDLVYYPGGRVRVQCQAVLLGTMK